MTDRRLVHVHCRMPGCTWNRTVVDRFASSEEAIQRHLTRSHGFQAVAEQLVSEWERSDRGSVYESMKSESVPIVDSDIGEVRATELPSRGTVARRVFDVLLLGPVEGTRLSRIVKKSMCPKNTVSAVLSPMKSGGLVNNPEQGTWKVTTYGRRLHGMEED